MFPIGKMEVGWTIIFAKDDYLLNPGKSGYLILDLELGALWV